MRTISAQEVLGYFWIAVVLVFLALAWWKLNGYLHNDEICVLQSAFTCEQKSIYLEGGLTKINISVRNNLGRWIRITGFACSSEVPDPSLGYPSAGLVAASAEVLPDQGFSLSGTCRRAPGEKESDHFGGIVYILYEYRDEPSAPGIFTVVGNVRGSVGAKPV